MQTSCHDLGESNIQAPSITSFYSVNQQQDIFLQDEDRRFFLEDMLIHWLWQTGKFIYSEIGGQFGLTYSSVTRRLDAFKNRWEKEEKLKSQYEKFKSQIKV